MSARYIDGLPEGVEVVRYGKAEPGEFVLSSGLIFGPVSEAREYPSGLIVCPSKGYDFVYDIANDRNDAVKKYGKPRTLRATFTVENTRDEQIVRGMMNHCPGFQQLEEV